MIGGRPLEPREVMALTPGACRVLMMLTTGEWSVAELAAALDISQRSVRRHLSLLDTAGLVCCTDRWDSDGRRLPTLWSEGKEARAESA